MVGNITRGRSQIGRGIIPEDLLTCQRAMRLRTRRADETDHHIFRAYQHLHLSFAKPGGMQTFTSTFSLYYFRLSMAKTDRVCKGTCTRPKSWGSRCYSSLEYSGTNSRDLITDQPPTCRSGRCLWAARKQALIRLSHRSCYCLVPIIGLSLTLADSPNHSLIHGKS